MNFTELYGPIEDPGAFDGDTVLIVLAAFIIIAIVFVLEINPSPPAFVLSH